MNAFVNFRDISWLGLGQRPLTPSSQTPPAFGHLPSDTSDRGGAGNWLLQ